MANLLDHFNFISYLLFDVLYNHTYGIRLHITSSELDTVHTFQQFLLTNQITNITDAITIIVVEKESSAISLHTLKLHTSILTILQDSQ